MCDPEITGQKVVTPNFFKTVNYNEESAFLKATNVSRCILTNMY